MISNGSWAQCHNKLRHNVAKNLMVTLLRVEFTIDIFRRGDSMHKFPVEFSLNLLLALVCIFHLLKSNIVAMHLVKSGQT